MKKVIGVDFDDVLMSANPALVGFHNAHYGTSLAPEDMTSYMFNEVWGCDLPEALRRVHEFYRSSYHAEAQPLPGAVDAIAALEKGAEIMVVTARTDTMRPETYEWLEKHFPSLVGNVHFTSHFTPQVGTLTKGEICKKFGVNIFVDDAPMHIEKVAPHVEQAFLMDAPWNQNYVLTAPNIQRVHSWEEIRAFLGGI